MMDDLPILQAAARWFAILRRNVMTVEERESLARWLSEPSHRAALDRLQRSWEIAGRLVPERVPNAQPVRPPVSRRKAMGLIGGVAASLAIGVIGARQTGWLAPWGWDGEVETGIGEQREVTLSESSVIKLNAMSRLRWRMTRTERKVWLVAGDGLFIVSKDAARPFTVRAGSGVVQVLGTIFSVSLRDETGSLAVREGQVAYRPLSAPQGKANEAVHLSAGQGMRFGGHGIEPVVAVSPDQVGEWSDHFASFDRVALEDVVRELGRYFPLRVRIDPPAAAKRHVTLRLKIKDENATLDILSQLLSARVERSAGREIVLHLPS